LCRSTDDQQRLLEEAQAQRSAAQIELETKRATAADKLKQRSNQAAQLQSEFEELQQSIGAQQARLVEAQDSRLQSKSVELNNGNGPEENEAIAFDLIQEAISANVDQAREQNNRQTQGLSESLLSGRVTRAYSKQLEMGQPEKGIVPSGTPYVLPATLKQLRSDDPAQRAGALADIASQGGEEAFRLISDSFDDPSPQVRNAAARALSDLQPDRTSSFTRALREASTQRRGRIGTALADSGLANEAIHDLVGESREKTYSASSLLFLMVKAGEVQPLVRALENHQDLEVRLTAITLLATSGHPDTIAVFRRVAVRASLPSEVRSAAMEGLHQITANAQLEIE